MNESSNLLLSSLSENAISHSGNRRQVSDGDYGQEQLSHDLSMFLANPSLRAALADGSLDLTSYSDQVEKELQELESKCIEAYRSKSDEISSMRADLDICQSVLSQLQEMLLGFRADLGGLSGEIRQLQEKSRTLDVQLKNRKLAEHDLREFLEHIVIAPSVAHAITTGRVNPTFVQCVQELNQIYRDTHNNSKPQPWSANRAPGETTAGKEMQEQVRTLRLLAAARTREYFLEQMALLRRPQTNVRMIQVHGLVRYAALQDFLEEASPPFAMEVFNVYVESMSKTLQQLFRTYQAQLLQLDSTKTSATRQDVIAIDDQLLRDSLTTRAKKRVDVFCLGKRASDCLDDMDSHQPILAHVALAENTKYPYERLFRSLLGHLVDAVTNEHVFCRQFFKRDAFQLLFNGTFSLLLEQLENYLFGCHDALCLLLMIKVTHSYKRLARSRTIHSLDSFFDQCTKLLWPRLKIIMEANLRSLKQATAAKLGGVELHAHYMSRRFAEFTCSILLILQNTKQAPRPGFVSGTLDAVTPSKAMRSTSSVSGSSYTPGATDELASISAGEKLLEDLSEMIDEFIALLDRLSDEHASQTKKTVFVINNLDQVVSIFQERRVVGKEFNKFVEHLMTQRENFVDSELLATGFSNMIAFVQQTEADFASKRDTGVDCEVNAQEVEALVLSFASSWKSNIERINRDVLSYFSNFRNGMEILKQVLTQLLLYYTRFQDLIRKVWKNKLPPFCKDLVATSVILAEIKKYALAL
jgi:hypothetical protein